MLRTALRTVLGALLVLAIWRAVLAAFAIPAFVMPPPEAVAAAMAANASALGFALLLTLRNALAGLALALLIAMTLAAAFVASRRATAAMLPIVIALRTAPVLAIAPILIMVFGRGLATAMAVVVIVAFFPIMVNAMRGFAATPANALDLMHVLGAGWLRTLLRVRLPFALPHVFTGLRSAATGALLAAMLAEWLSGAKGLGTLILDASSFRRTALMWAAVIVSMLAAFALFALTSGIERRFTGWRHRPATEAP